MMLAAAESISVHETERLVSFTLIELLAILVAARLAGKAAHLLRQPRVVGEIVGGLLLGPSLFGRVFPNQFAFVFHSIPPMSLIILSQIGLCLLMFQIGLEFDFTQLNFPPYYCQFRPRSSFCICCCGFFSFDRCSIAQSPHLDRRTDVCRTICSRSCW